MPDTLPVQPVTSPLNAVIDLPGSKSITNRALMMAALADGSSRISGALFCDDTRYMCAALQRLGIPIIADVKGCAYEVRGMGGVFPSTSVDLFVGNSGTSARFLTAALALGNGTYRLDGVPRMRQRPINDLLTALRELGVDVRAEHNDECLPLIIRAAGLRGGHAVMRADMSSQFLSALLMVASYGMEPVEIELHGKMSSEPYVELTLLMMRQWGVDCSRSDRDLFTILNGQRFIAQDYSVEPDATSASYFFAAAAVTNGRVRVNHLTQDSLQGDTAFIDVLAQMGCEVTRGKDFIEVQGTSTLHGVDVDMNRISDTVMTLAAIAPFADSPTIIRNVAHIRNKESDRIKALCNELIRLGVQAEARADGLIIQPCKEMKPALIETYDDHRMAMSFTITGLRSPGVVIHDPECVGKTFPDFFQRIRLMREQNYV